MMMFDAEVRSFELTGLPVFTQYTFTLQAINSVGEGQIFQRQITTREEGLLFRIRS